MRTEYRKELAHNYMILCEEGAEAEENHELRTIYANRIEGLLPLSVEYRDGEIRCRYEITGMLSFAACCESMKVTSDDLRMIYMGLLDLLSLLEDYLLNPDHLLLDPEYLYMEWSARRVQAAFLPDERRPVREKLISLTEYLISRAGFREPRSVLLLCAILKELKESASQISDLRRVLSEDAGDREEGGRPRGLSPQGYAARTADAPVFGGEETLPDFSDGGFGTEEEPEDPAEEAADAGFGGAGQDAAGKRAGRESRRKRPGGLFAEAIPERYTVILALFMAAASGVVWTALRLQTFYLLSTAETAGGAAAGAALIFACAAIAGKAAGRRNAGRRRADDAAADAWPKDGYPEEYGGKEGYFCEDLTDPSFRFRGDAAYPGTAGQPDFRGRDYENGSPFFTWAEEEGGFEEDAGGQTVLLDEKTGAGEKIPASMTPVDRDAGLPPFVLEDRDLLIGKKKSQSDRVIPDETVSRIHARIARRGGRSVICDMGSRNGTSVNGRPLVGREEAVLSDGDIVTFARCAYVFHEGSA